MDTCADCGKPIGMTEPHYRRVAIDGGTSYHSACGDPFGIKAKNAEIERLLVSRDRWEKTACDAVEEVLRLRSLLIDVETVANTIDLTPDEKVTNVRLIAALRDAHEQREGTK